VGNFDDNPVRLDIGEPRKLAGLDFIINVLYNRWARPARVFRRRFKTRLCCRSRRKQNPLLHAAGQDKDIVIVNAFVKASEASSCLNIAYPAVGQKGGDVVLIANEPAGQIVHYMFGGLAVKFCGPEYKVKALPVQSERLIVYSEYPDIAGRSTFPKSEKGDIYGQVG